MTIRAVVKYPNEILRHRSLPVDPDADDVTALIRDMWDTLDAHGGVGLAAPQIGSLLRIIVVDATRARRPVANHGRLCLINPQLLDTEGATAFREGCMSVPDLVARIPRSQRVVVAGHLPDGSPVTIISEGFEAVVFQHEIDHLDGILFIDRVHSASDLRPRASNG